MTILVTGGAGYIGSHAVQRLLNDGHRVVVLDNLDRGHREAVDALRGMAGVGADQLFFEAGDIADGGMVGALMRDHGVDTVMHFAALAYVGESVHEPLRYHRVNTAGAIALLEAADGAGVSRFIFSSTCATYGEPGADEIPIHEGVVQRPINPYGASKLAVERVLADYSAKCKADGRAFSYAALRYFNVAGSDPTGLIGEDHEPETHLIPVILQAALGKRDGVTIFGTDYATEDGTCVRDYIHVCDLVDAHVAVMNALEPGDARLYNLGIGRGYSVREIIDAAKRVTGKEFAVREGARRAGDPPVLYADASKIGRELGWKAKYTDIDEIIATAWRWFEKHPDGYAS